MPNRPLSWLTGGLLATALLLMLLHFLIYLYFSIDLMRFPFDYDQGEGFELVAVQYLSEGRNPYPDTSLYPYFGDLYPFFYHLVLVPFAWLFGPELWYGRLVAFLGTLITAGAIAYAVHRAEKRAGIALLLGLAFLASNFIYHIGPLFRQHYFMVMLETLAVVSLANLFELEDPRQQRRKLLLGLGLLLAALYTKQLAYPTAAAVFIWLFLRQPRRAIITALGFSLAGALVFALMMLLTGGHWWENAFAANVNPYLYGQFRGLAELFLRLHWVLLAFAALMSAYELYFARLSLYSLWWVAATLNTVTAGKWGAGDSYFATSIAAACLLSGIFIARSLNQGWHFEANYLSRLLQPLTRPLQGRASLLWQGVSALSLAGMVIYGATVVKLPTSEGFAPIAEALNVQPKIAYRYPLYDAADWTPGYALLGHLLSEEDHANGWRIVERVRASDAPVLSEEAMFNILAGKEVIGNPVHLKNQYENGIFDPSNLVQDLEAQRFGLVILRAAFYPPPVVAAIHDAYEPVDAIEMNGFSYQFWEPSPTWEQRRAVRNFLEAPNAEQLVVALGTVEDASDWLKHMMGRWAWLPDLGSPAPGAGNCPSYHYVRRGLRTQLRYCEGELQVSAPQPLE